MLLEEQVRGWQQNVLNSYCPKCSDNCCNPNKHRIMLDSFSIPLFQEKGVSLVKTREVDKPTFRSNQLRFRNGSYIQKPSLVQMPKWIYGDEWYLYADSCPFYNKEKGCEIHENPRRPDVCKKYPTLFRGCNDPEGKLVDIRVMNSCECFRQEKIRKELIEKFPIRILE